MKNKRAKIATTTKTTTAAATIKRPLLHCNIIIIVVVAAVILFLPLNFFSPLNRGAYEIICAHLVDFVKLSDFD